jgi:two-component system, OmpR family, response regulator
MTLDRKHRVLVVEDESLIRTCLAEGLTDAGYHVTTAHNGAEALERIGEERPDAILLDLLMPVMDGLEFLSQRHAQPRLAALPVVVLSAAGVSSVRDAKALRATAVLSKPIDLDVLSEVLEHVLSEAAETHSHAPQPVHDDAVITQPLGICPICKRAPTAEIEAADDLDVLVREIYRARRVHVLSHTAREIAQVPLRCRLLAYPPGRREILADWVSHELRQEWGDQDRRAVHSIDEVLDSPAVHRFWQDATSCGSIGCRHD